MQNEIVTESHILPPGVEVSFGLLATPHAFVEIIVNPNGFLQAANSDWRLYDVTTAGEALIWHGALTPPFEGAQRLVTGIQAGARIELRAFSKASVPTTGAVTASLVGYDPDCCTGDTGSGDGCSPFLDQPTWFFDALDGNDTNTGTTEETALQTWAEWTRRIGADCELFPILSPLGGLLTLNRLTDLPDDDPLNFRAFLAPGCTAISPGQVIEVASGTLTAVGAQDRANNLPRTITDGGVADWMPYLRLYIEITSGVAVGARAIVLRDLGTGTAHVSEWTDPFVQVDGFVPPAAELPSPGDTYRVVDFSSLILGEMVVGYNRAEMLPNAVGAGVPPGGFCLQLFHARRNTADNFTNNALPAIASYPDTISAFSYGIVDGPCIIPSSGNGTLGACSMGGTISARGGGIMILGANRNDDPGDYPGGFSGEPGSHFTFVGDIAFVGDIHGVGSACDVRTAGWLEAGPTSTWDSLHGAFTIAGGKIWFGNDTGLGESGFVPYWGNGNANIGFFPTDSFLQFEQFQFAAPVALPSWEGANGPGGIIATLDGGQFGGTITEKGFCFDRATGLFKPLGGANVTWANFAIPFAGGGFEEYTEDDGMGFVVNNAVACNPSTGSKIVWSVGIFTP